ncbi:hypothetical protein GGU11DRAFT_880372 [Lentinula aff. detonsa]|nr:hypothetical protein GGU11DRAFT_880372 [Lentinula aff. detonsa]
MSSALSAENISLLEVESISLSVGSILFGIYVVIAALSLHTLVMQDSDFTQGRRFLCAVITLMLLFDTMNTASSVYSVAHDIRTLEESFHPQATRILILSAAILSKINYFLSDLVIVWRTWSIYEEKTILFHIVMSSCIFLSFGAVIADIVLAIESSDNLKEMFKLDYATVRLILPLSLLLTNVVATSFIALRTWIFHKSVKYTSAAESGRIKNVMQVLFLLVESGCLYCILWIVVILDITAGFSVGVQYLLTSIIPHLTYDKHCEAEFLSMQCIYPCLMVLIIAIRKRRYDNMNSTTWSTSPYTLSSIP